MALEKAVITNTVSREQVTVMFNPEEYTLSKDINYGQTGIPGLSAPILQFVNGNLQTLSMELLLDTFETHRENNRVLARAGDDVRKLVEKITNLMSIDPTTHAPPVLIFTWGPSLSFTCVLARAQQRFILFQPDGTPVRARLTVTFNEYRNIELEAKEIKRETSDYTKRHVVRQGETLSSIAAACYGNPRLWRPIALNNGIDDPRVLTPGSSLMIPQLPYRHPESGEVFT